MCGLNGRWSSTQLYRIPFFFSLAHAHRGIIETGDWLPCDWWQITCRGVVRPRPTPESPCIIIIIIKKKMKNFACLALLAITIVSVEAFYLPGLRPTNFCKEDVKKKDETADCKVIFCRCILAFHNYFHYRLRCLSMSTSWIPLRPLYPTITQSKFNMECDQKLIWFDLLIWLFYPIKN